MDCVPRAVHSLRDCNNTSALCRYCGHPGGHGHGFSANAQSETAASTEQPIADDVVVRVAPQFEALRALTKTHIEIKHYQGVTDLDDAELARLLALAEQDVRKLILPEAEKLCWLMLGRHLQVM